MRIPALLLFAAVFSSLHAKSVWSGVFSEAQAAQGATEYEAHCSTSCHQPRLNGYGGVLIGELFMEHWREDNLNNFFARTKATMPRNAPGSLSDRVYLEILAFILRKNGFPAGQSDLSLAGLEQIQIEGKDGPQPVPEFSLVKVVGCLTQDGAGAWVLERATAARRTRDPQASPARELQASAALSGSGLVHFLRVTKYDAESFRLEAQKGHGVEAKGFLMRKPEGETLNLTSVTTVSGNCSR